MEISLPKARNEFNNLKLGKFPSFDAYCQRIRELSGQLKDVDAPVTDQRLVLQLVRGLPPEYDTVAAYINQTLPTFETARSMIELENHRQASRDEATTLVTNSVPSTDSRGGEDGTSSRHQKRHHSGKRSHHKGGSTGGSSRHQTKQQTTTTSVPMATPWGPLPTWPATWTPPPCPYPTYPGWTAPWPSWPAPPSSSTSRPATARPGHRQSSTSHGQAYVASDDGPPPQATDLAQVFAALQMQPPPPSPFYMDTGASSHLSADAVAAVGAIILLARSDVKHSATIFRRNIRHIRNWLEEESSAVSKSVEKGKPKELKSDVHEKDGAKGDK
ncbi:hypothetical protein KSS87_020516 [Heliosperma pusillum]|nr:hypothetical protein KSS87_020516 [Heliosperma pusillum]